MSTAQELFLVMSDWNPAEMLGESPNLLATSLYKVFITNETWFKQRKQFGYRGSTKDPLMFNFGTKGFIDVRASLNSFLTKSLNEEECERVIDYQIDKLIANPELHDKVEFEIAETSYNFGIRSKLKKRYKDILSAEAIDEWVKDLKDLETNYFKILKQNNTKIISFYSKLNPADDFLNKKTINNVKNFMGHLYHID